MNRSTYSHALFEVHFKHSAAKPARVFEDFFRIVETQCGAGKRDLVSTRLDHFANGAGLFHNQFAIVFGKSALDMYSGNDPGVGLA